MWSIDPRAETPVYVQLASAIAVDIRRGALRTGDRLPSTRSLAAQLEVNRNTIVAAFAELAAQGWVATSGARGTRVVDAPEHAVRTVAAPVARALYDLRDAPSAQSPFPAAATQLSLGVPDTRLVPHALIARAYRRALRTKRALDYADARGTPRLRAAIATWLRERGLAVGPDNVMITRGSQMAIDLAARLLLGPGDVAAVEELGYQPAWRALAATGATLAAVPLDRDGLVVEHVPKARVVYVTPHHQYPTTVLMSPARRLALLAHAHRERIAIIEDDYDHEFHFDGRPVAPLAAIDQFRSVIYAGTLSKILAPGLRLGFVAATERVIDQLARLRAVVDRQGDHALELAIAELVEDGEVTRHARKMRRVYAARRDAVATALTRELGTSCTFALPAGGITLWVHVDPAIDVERWQARALERGVAVAIARDFALDRRRRPYLRLGFAHLSETEMLAALRVLRRSLPR